MSDVETWTMDYIIERKTDDGWVWHAAVHDEAGYNAWLAKQDNPENYRLITKEK